MTEHRLLEYRPQSSNINHPGSQAHTDWGRALAPQRLSLTVCPSPRLIKHWVTS